MRSDASADADAESKEEDASTATPRDPRQRPSYHKYPYVASELFACEVSSMLDVLFEHPQLLDLLFTFLDHPAPMDPSHASYFRKLMVVLIQRKYDALVKYIQSHHIIDKLVAHIGLYSIMEILIMIGWDDGLGQVNDVEWLYREQLIPKLVAKLTPDYESATDVHMNAARALVDVVVKSAPTAKNLLIQHLQSTEVLSTIFSHMFSGSLSSLTNSMSIIIVLVQRYANRRVEAGEEKTADSPAGSAGAEEEAPLEEPFLSLQPHLHKIIALLHQPQAEVKVQFGSSQPFGETRMKVVELTLVLLRSRLPAVDRQLSELHVLSLMLESFFLYPWNNMLHGLVESIVRTVLDSESEVLRHSLFTDGQLVDRFVAAYERSEREQSEKGGYRLGYMGHLLRTSMAIEDVARKSDDTRKQLFGPHADKWSAFVNEQLERENEKQKVVAPFVGQDEDILDGLQFDLAGMNTEVNPYTMGGAAGGEGGRGGSMGGNAGGGGGGGGGDGYDFNEAEDEENGGTTGGAGSMGYDYTHSYTIRDPDTEYDDPAAESEEGWRSGGSGGGGGSSEGDDWGSNFSTHFPAEEGTQQAGSGSGGAAGGGRAKNGEFDRGTATSGRQVIEFGAGREEEEDDFGRNGVSADDPFAVAAAQTATGSSAPDAAAAWPTSDFGSSSFDADFDADFSAAPHAADASETPAAAAAGGSDDSHPPATATKEAAPVDDFDAEFPPA